jgi:O-antigen/teichoic acid export membrane protein
MVSMPLWSAYTDAFHRNDFGWIKNMLRKQLKIFGCVIVAACLLTWLAEPIISVWIGPNLVVSSHLILAMAIFVVISCWNNIYAMFVNGIGQIKLQLYTAIVAMFINIPLSIYFAKHTELGLSGIVAGTICSLLLAAIALPLQVYYLISRPLNTPSDHMKIGADV